MVGAKWRYAGLGIVPASTDKDVSTGDPHCVCLTSHLPVDPYGRAFVPDVFRFRVEVVDPNRDFIGRFGRYGHADAGAGRRGSGVREAGRASATLKPDTRNLTPEIVFAWPAFVTASEDRLYVSDSLNRRGTVIRRTFDA